MIYHDNNVSMLHFFERTKFNTINILLNVHHCISNAFSNGTSLSKPAIVKTSAFPHGDIGLHQADGRTCIVAGDKVFIHLEMVAVQCLTDLIAVRPLTRCRGDFTIIKVFLKVEEMYPHNSNS